MGRHLSLNLWLQWPPFPFGQSKIFIFLSLLQWRHWLLPCPILECARGVTKTPQISHTINCPAAASQVYLCSLHPALLHHFFCLPPLRRKWIQKKSQELRHWLHEWHSYTMSCTTHSTEWTVGQAGDQRRHTGWPRQPQVPQRHLNGGLSSQLLSVFFPSTTEELCVILM